MSAEMPDFEEIKNEGVEPEVDNYDELAEAHGFKDGDLPAATEPMKDRRQDPEDDRNDYEGRMFNRSRHRRESPDTSMVLNGLNGVIRAFRDAGEADRRRLKEGWSKSGPRTA